MARTRTLSLAARPQTLQSVVGQAAVKKAITRHATKPKAWMFAGGTGTGKTTLARIVALSLQCTHVKAFGYPCKQCRKNRNQFDIMEINASQVRGVDDLANVAALASYAPRPPSIRRVFILDEAQRMTTAAQNLLLKPFEDCPETAVWIICTTDPERILPTLRNRCVFFKLAPLRPAEVSTLATRTGKILGLTEKQVNPIIDQLMEADVRSPRNIVQAVEQAQALGDPKAAVHNTSTDDQEITVRALNGLMRGDWRKLRLILKDLPVEDAHNLILAIMGTLKTVLLKTDRSTIQTQLAALGIRRLSRILYMEDRAKSAILISVLYELSEKFKGVKWQVAEQDDEDDLDEDED